MSTLKWGLFLGALSAAATAAAWMWRTGRIPKPEFAVRRRRGGRWSVSVTPGGRSR